ncbi:GAT domain-containing protein [Plectosphaerella cucumerina]|uniref:GAT domain-containing protein n=1 Tax=Plectosphaerella cucumerina TaxID=40658 RepID=A0A8K0TBP8_9PEZI|nr:GAT domain-containing protein [Plectosphaerella cucumerina]
MPSMKGLSMNRMIGTIKKRTGTGLGGSSSDPSVVPANETVEATAVRSLRQFCESGGPNKQGDEVLYLPPIVDAAESSPAAASECARQIRKYLTRENKAKASWQYNAIMVMRILTDNPGKSFTKNVDRKFVDAVRETLRANRDPSVQQILMETLDDFERSKADHEGLAELIAMWKAEKEYAWSKLQPQQPAPSPWQHAHQSQNYFARDHSNRKLPNPVELASRLEEARTSAKLLSQVVSNTPPEELLNNDLVKEFADRCHSASKSMQLYMLAENPAPDNDTMESIIDTNEQLQTALNQHQRAVLTARKKLGLNTTSEHNSPTVMSPAPGGPQPPVPDTRPPPQQPQQFQQTPPPGQHSPPAPQAPATNSFSRLFSRKPTHKSNESERFEPPAGPPPGPPPKQQYTPPPAAAATQAEQDDPFRDPQPDAAPPPPPQKLPPGPPADGPRLAYEPYHPGFQQTSSYLDRQESAHDNATMHGGANAATPGGLNTRNLQNNDDLYGADDLYESSPNRKEPPRRL